VGEGWVRGGRGVYAAGVDTFYVGHTRQWRRPHEEEVRGVVVGGGMVGEEVAGGEVAGGGIRFAGEVRGTRGTGAAQQMHIGWTSCSARPYQAVPLVPFVTLAHVKSAS